MQHIHFLRKLEITEGSELNAGGAFLDTNSVIERLKHGNTALVIGAETPTFLLKDVCNTVYVYYFDGVAIVKRAVGDYITTCHRPGNFTLDSAKVIIEPRFDNGASLARIFLGQTLRFRWINVDTLSSDVAFPAADVSGCQSYSLLQDEDAKHFVNCPIVGHWARKGLVYDDFLFMSAIKSTSKDVLGILQL